MNDAQTEIAELLDALEFAEGALVDYTSSEGGLEIETANRIARMCSELLLKHGRISAVNECSKRPAV